MSLDDRAVRVVCVHCDTTRAVNHDGSVRVHTNQTTGRRCAGSGRDQSGFPRGPLVLSDAQIRALRLDPRTTLEERTECASALNEFGSRTSAEVARARSRCAEIYARVAREPALTPRP